MTACNTYIVLLSGVYLACSYYINNFLATIAKKKFARLFLVDEDELVYIVENSVLSLDDYSQLNEVCADYNDCIAMYPWIRCFIGLPCFFSATKKFLKSKQRIQSNIDIIKKNLYRKK
jgi:hypothetical protein